MAHNWLTTQLIARKVMDRLIEELTFPNLVYSGYSDELARGKGDTIQVPVPVTLQAKSFNTAQGIQPQDITETKVDIKLDKIADVSTEFTALESARNVRDLEEQFIIPAAVALAQKINADGFELAKDVTNSIGTAGTTPSTLEDFANAAKALDDEKVPMTDRVAVWNTSAVAKFRQLDALVNVDKSGSNSALRNGYIGDVYGFTNYMSQVVPVVEGEGDEPDAVQNLAFHKNAFAFVTAPLTAPSGVDSYTTSYNGISLRVTKGYDMIHKKDIVSVDVLYGYKTLNKNMAVRVLG